MTTQRKLALALGSLTLAAALLATPAEAFAQTTTPPALRRGEVSQINGHPVPVGEHNEYYYGFRRHNLATNPIGWIFGSWGLSYSYAFHDNLALRVDGNFTDPPGERGTEIEAGAGLPVYFRRAYQGLFLEPGFIVRRVTRWHFDDGLEPRTILGPQVMAGWHWSWDSGLNVAIAMGGGRDLANADGIFFNSYLRFGYSF